MFISSNGKRARTKLLEILVRLNYDKLKCLRAVKYPAPRRIRLFTQGQDKVFGHFGGTINESADIGRTIQCYWIKEDQHKYFRVGDTVCETTVINDKEDDWYITGSRADIHYSDNTSRAVAFGSYQSGEGIKSPQFPAVHLTRIPAPTGWPVPSFVNHPSSLVTLNESFYSEPGY